MRQSWIAETGCISRSCRSRWMNVVTESIRATDFLWSAIAAFIDCENNIQSTKNPAYWRGSATAQPHLVFNKDLIRCTGNTSPEVSSPMIRLLVVMKSWFWQPRLSSAAITLPICPPEWSLWGKWASEEPVLAGVSDSRVGTGPSWFMLVTFYTALLLDFSCCLADQGKSFFSL